MNWFELTELLSVLCLHVYIQAAVAAAAG